LTRLPQRLSRISAEHLRLKWCVVVADRFSLPANVLRHWESVGLLSPARDSAGRRRYSRDDAVRVAVILRSKAAGMSLDQIAHLLERDMAGRHRVLQAHIDDLDRRMEEMRRSRAMAEHALRCSAHDISTCPRFRAELSDLLAEFPAGSHGSERA